MGRLSGFQETLWPPTSVHSRHSTLTPHQRAETGFGGDHQDELIGGRSLGEGAVQAKALEEEGGIWEGLGFPGEEHGSRMDWGRGPKWVTPQKAVPPVPGPRVTARAR